MGKELPAFYEDDRGGNEKILDSRYESGTFKCAPRNKSGEISAVAVRVYGEQQTIHGELENPKTIIGGILQEINACNAHWQMGRMGEKEMILTSK